MDTIQKYIWVLFIVFSFAHAFLLKHNSKKYITDNPGLEKGYDKAVKAILIYGNIPWIIMMIGNLSGLTKNISDYFYPSTMNPTVLLFHFYIVVIWSLCIRWIYFKNGAEFIEMHPGILQKHAFGTSTDVTAKEVKIVFPLMLLGGIVGMVMMWFKTVPITQL